MASVSPGSCTAATESTWSRHTTCTWPRGSSTKRSASERSAGSTCSSQRPRYSKRCWSESMTVVIGPPSLRRVLRQDQGHGLADLHGGIHRVVPRLRGPAVPERLVALRVPELHHEPTVLPARRGAAHAHLRAGPDGVVHHQVGAVGSLQSLGHEGLLDLLARHAPVRVVALRVGRRRELERTEAGEVHRRVVLDVASQFTGAGDERGGHRDPDERADRMHGGALLWSHSITTRSWTASIRSP